MTDQKAMDIAWDLLATMYAERAEGLDVDPVTVLRAKHHLVWNSYHWLREQYPAPASCTPSQARKQLERLCRHYVGV